MKRTLTSKPKKRYSWNRRQPSHPAPRSPQQNDNNKSGGHQALCEANTGDTYGERRRRWEQHHFGTAIEAATTLHTARPDQIHPTSIPKNPDVRAAPALGVSGVPCATYRWAIPKYPCHWTERTSLGDER
ncbi:hypothetical protein K443DRAFT_489819 [Laccaria amethystina LaAM-08-1]|uniref:Uncharacterized protein n=1 Tax=Laccaria amethystina LaAM-08-1 TaxID=1095629 RepID=A0A0C9WT28_9AGAR|nr:hypothetical protein K443DRAFT_489819 [Laccaria amethystina LaAM-08-1]